MNNYKEQVDSLDVVSKWKVYCRYLRSHLSLKYSISLFLENASALIPPF